MKTRHPLSLSCATGLDRAHAAGRHWRARLLGAVMAMAMVPAAWAADLQITELSDTGYDPSPVGAEVVYSVRIENAASDDARDTVVLFDLPAGTALASSAPASCAVQPGNGSFQRVMCRNPGVLNAATGAYAFKLPVTTLQRAVGSMRVIAVAGYASALPAADVDLSSLSLSSDAFFGNDTNPANNRLWQDTTLTASTDLRLAKTATPSPVIGGGEISYTLSVTNHGPSVASGFKVTDTLDANTALVAGSASGAGWVFTGASATYNGSLAVGASASYSYRAKVNIGSGNVSNGAVVATGVDKAPDTNPDNNTAQVTTPVLPGADLAIHKSATPAPVPAGANITFTLTARNEGPSLASDVLVSDALPAGFDVVSATPGKGSCSVAAGTVSCQIGTLAAGQQTQVVVVAQVPAAGPNSQGSVTNTATIASSTADPVTANNTGAVTFDVLADGADLVMGKQKSPARVAVWPHSGSRSDSVIASILKVTNQGPRAVEGNLQVVDILADGEQWVDANGNPYAANVPVTIPGNWSCSTPAAYADGQRQVVTCDMTGSFPVASGTARSVTVHTLARKAGVLTNEACTGGAGGSVAPLTAGGINRDPDLGNNCAGAGVVATELAADLSISKQTNGAGDADNLINAQTAYVDFTLVVTNHGAPTPGVVVNDPLPGFVSGKTTVQALSVPAGWTCALQTSAWNCRSGTTVLGTNQTATITFRVHRGLFDSLNEAARSCAGVAQPAGRFCNTAQVQVDLNQANALGEVDKTNNSASDWLVIEPVANVVTAAKNITSGSPGRAGVETVYAISYRNDGPSAVTDVVFRDVFTLPAADAGFVLLSAVRSGGGGAQCVVSERDSGIIATTASGGTAYRNDNASAATLTVTCPRLSLSNGQGETLTVKIRPNVNAGNTGRQLQNTADFFFDFNGDGQPDAGSGVLPGGASFDYNQRSDDDSKQATLPFEAGSVDLLVNKEDSGFTGAVDPLGFDSRPGMEANNRILYRISVRNQGPSLASGVRITDTLTPPNSAQVKLVGTRTGTQGAPDGALVSIDDAAARCQLVAGSNPNVQGQAQTVQCQMPSAGSGMVGEGQIASGQTSYLYLVYEYVTAPPATGETLDNAVTASANETETNPGNNTATQTTSIRTRTDLEVVKQLSTVLPDTDPSVAVQAATEAALFQPVWYVLDVTNKGPGHSRSIERSAQSKLAGTGTVITDTLVAGLELMPGAQASWRKIDSVSGSTETDLTASGTGTCAVAGKTLTCQLGDVALDGRARVLIPARWVSYPVNGQGSNKVSLRTEQIDPTPDNDDSTVTNTITRSSVAGVVFVDSERSGGNGGSQQAGETGLAGVTITLGGNDKWGNPVSKTVVTDANGAYRFTDLAPSDAAGYSLTQTQPGSHVNGPDLPPASGSLAPSHAAQYSRGESSGDSSWTQLVLAEGVDAVRYNFPEVRRPALSGHVYVDADFDDVRSGTDPAIAGVLIELLDASDGSVLATTTTAANGSYQFNSLDPLRSYVLREVLPAGGYRNRPTAVNPGLIDGLACAACVAGSGMAGDAPGTDRIGNIDLSRGFDGTNFDFGEDAITAISGTVYVDRNRDGLFDAADAGSGAASPNGGLPGVSLTLFDDQGVAVATTTTDASGNYVFDALVVGRDYRVVQSQPAGYGNGRENPGNSLLISKLPAAGAHNNNFGEVLGALAGVVYEDYSPGIAGNNNGIIDAGERPIAGVILTLSGTDINGVAVNLTTTTAADGSYRFDDLLPADGAGYRLVQTQPSGYLDGRHTPGDAVLAGSNAQANQFTAINLAPGQQAGGYVFGELAAVALAGTVYYDVNNDGVMAGAAETGIEGVRIALSGTDDQGNAVSLATITDAAGNYRFDDLRPGIYTVTEPQQPPGTSNGITGAGRVAGVVQGVATDVATVPSAIAGIDLRVPGSQSQDNLFGEIPRNSSIGGTVFMDHNNDGVVDPGETGLANVQLTLVGTDINGEPVSRTTTTDANGDYVFADLPPGSYSVIEPQQPSGTGDGRNVAGSTGGTGSAAGVATPATPSTISSISVGVGEHSQGNNFGEIALGSISGKVYNDGNDNGIAENDEGGYAGIVIDLVGSDDLGNPVSLSTTTDADGNYRFEGLRPGTYTVTETTQPAETLNGITTAGSIGGSSVGVATGTDTVPSAISQIVLPIGGDSIHNNFGEVGDSSDIQVSKSLDSAKLTVNNRSTYTISVRNAGQKPSQGEYMVEDRLPVGITLAAVPSGDGWTCSGAVGDSRFSCRSSAPLAPGARASSLISVPVNVAAQAASAGVVSNAVIVSGGGDSPFRTPSTAERASFEGDVTELPECVDGINHNACRLPIPAQLSASVGGTVWFDGGSEDAQLDGGDKRLADWIVELVDPSTDTVARRITTAADGSYTFSDVIPGKEWNIRFRDPVSGIIWAWPVNQEQAGSNSVGCDTAAALANGTASACRGSADGVSQLLVVLAPGEHLPQQSLPVDPAGVVYDAVSRDPVPGSIVTLTPVGMCPAYDPALAVLNATAGGYRIQGSAISMTVGNDGFYQFIFGPGAPASCEYRLDVTPPSGYQFVSGLIAPENGALSPPGRIGENWLVQPQPTPPTVAVGEGTRYWLNVISGSGTAGIIHNHIPLDTAAPAGLVITKTGDRQIVELGDTVQYTISVRQTAGSALSMVNIVDTLPRGFTYINGTARLGGRALADPAGAPGPRLGFALGAINVGEQLALTYRVRVGVGALQGDGINRAQAHGCSINGGCITTDAMSPLPGSIPSNQAQYRVRVTGGVFSTEACVLGKVFVDCNLNHVQDEEELGIPGVRLYFSDGTWLVSDVEGKYSYCGLPANSHTLKVDASTLPQGARLTTSSNRNLGDADSLLLDLKNGELHRADFIEGSCANPVLEQVRARRSQGEVRAAETEAGQPSLRFDSKPLRAPQQATDSANQRPIVQPRTLESVDASQEVQP